VGLQREASDQQSVLVEVIGQIRDDVGAVIGAAEDHHVARHCN